MRIEFVRTFGIVSLASLAMGCGLFAPRPAWEESPPPPAENAIVSSDDLYRVTLPNGLEVIVLEDDRLPRVALGITLRRGAGSVEPSLAGVAELAAEVMQRGAGERDALALAKVVEDVGASLAISSGWDTTSISLSGLSEDRALLFEILQDVALRARFDEVEFAKARAEQQAAIVAAQDDPATLIRWHALRALFDDHRYGLPRSGTAETIAQINVEQARAYWADRFVPRNTIFWAVGDFRAAELIPEVRRVFEGLSDVPVISNTPPTPPTPPTPTSTPGKRRVVVVDKPDLLQARIIVAHEGIRRTEPTRIAAGIMNDALGGSGFSSRLMKKIRSEEGLTYGVGSGFSMRSQPGPFSVSTFTRVSKVRQVVDLVLQEMEAIRSDRPIVKEELGKFISYNIGRFGLSLETSDAVLSSLVDLDVHALPANSLDTYRSRVRAVTLDDVTRAAELRLHPDRAVIVVLGPAEAVVPELEDLGEVEVWQP
jgi:zinc protease